MKVKNIFEVTTYFLVVLLCVISYSQTNTSQNVSFVSYDKLMMALLLFSRPY